MRLKSFLLTPVGETLVRALYASWVYSLRVERVGEDPPPPVLYIFWHSKDFVLPRTHRNTRVGVLVSRHEDGEVPARLIQKFGLIPVRGSATRGGVSAVKTMIRLVKAGHSLAITPDGPRGPRFRMKPEVLKLARKLSLPIVPVGVAYGWKWMAPSWDRYEVPFPGSRVVVVLDPPLHPASLTPEILEARLMEANARAEARLRGDR